MDADRVKVTVGQTINIGNYESARVDATIECVIESAKGETAQQAFELAYLEAKKAFVKIAANFVPKKKEGK